MSTESTPSRRRMRPRRAPGRRFVVAFAAVLALAAVVGGVGAAASALQGPRATDVQIDPAAAIDTSGARMIITTSQALADIDPAQVTVTPAVPFTVDVAGRTVGVRFATPLWDDTDYTVTIDGVQGVGGGRTATIEEGFHTPAAGFFLLQRGDDEDTVFRTDLTGEGAVPVFRYPHIEDFRATANHLVVSGRTDDDQAVVIVTDLTGGNQRELTLPGQGYVSNLQSSDRGERIGYTFSTSVQGGEDSLESELFTVSLRDDDAQPTAIAVAGADARTIDWRFVPGTDSILSLSFDGTLWLTDGTGGDATSLGTAVAIDGVEGTTALIETVDGYATLDLSTGQTTALAAADSTFGLLRNIVLRPDGTTLRVYATIGPTGLPAGAIVAAADAADTAETPVFTVPDSDSYLRTCLSPNGRYAAVLTAPNAIENSYDGYYLPLPGTVETHIVEIGTARDVVALSGFDISWCRTPPQ